MLYWRQKHKCERDLFNDFYSISGNVIKFIFEIPTLHTKTRLNIIKECIMFKRYLFICVKYDAEWEKLKIHFN